MLTGVTVADTRGATGCSFPSAMAVGVTLTPCDYTRTAPVVPGAAIEMNYDNSATVDTTQTALARSDVRVIVSKPPPSLQVIKRISPYGWVAMVTAFPGSGSSAT